MSKKRNRIPKDGPVWHRSAEEATLDKMPKYNAHACGTGPHGDAKYNRAKQKQAWRRELERQEARTRGPLPYTKDASSGCGAMGRFRVIATPTLTGNYLTDDSEAGPDDRKIQRGFASD